MSNLNISNMLGNNKCLQLCHERLHSMKEFACSHMRDLLQIQALFECEKQLVEFFRPDHRPWYDFQFPSMKARDEVGTLFLFYDLLKLEGKPSSSSGYAHSRLVYSSYETLLVGYFYLVTVDDVLRARSYYGRRGRVAKYLLL